MEGEFYVYIILCEKGKFYIGLSSNPKRRLEAHNKGLSRWTRRYKNWKIVYLEKFDNYTEARKREIYLKKQKGGNKFKEILSGAHNPAKRDCRFESGPRNKGS
jgi:putative endonuclease